MRTDGRTDMTKLLVVFRNFTKAPNNDRVSLHHQPTSCEFNFHGSMLHVSMFVNKTSLVQFFRYLLYPSQLLFYMFRMLLPSILRSTVMYRREGTIGLGYNNNNNNKYLKNCIKVVLFTKNRLVVVVQKQCGFSARYELNVSLLFH